MCLVLENMPIKICEVIVCEEKVVSLLIKRRLSLDVSKMKHREEASKLCLFFHCLRKLQCLFLVVVSD